jgi:molybdate transport system ATP-binding protein
LFYQQRYYSIGDTNIPKVKDLFDNKTNPLALTFPDTLNIENLLDLELTRLSNGQLKKVLILHNLVKAVPKFILLDYPFEGLDKESRSDLIDFIDRLATMFSIQVIITDHNHELPEVINCRLVLREFEIEHIGRVGNTSAHFIRPAAPPETIESKTDHEENIPVVAMKNLTIQYGNKKIINNLNWTINQGDRWALTGKNGSGKTTLFSLIYADHPMAYSQEVFLFGKRRGSGESIWDIKNRINYLGPEQIHFLNPGSTLISARQNILIQAPGTDHNLEKLIKFFQVESFIDHPVRWLSSGQLQMMLLIKSFMRTRELILLDEPFQFLDPASKHKVVQYLNQYLSSHTTLVLITHYEDDLVQWTQKRMNL